MSFKNYNMCYQGDRPDGMIKNNWGSMHSDKEVMTGLYEAVIIYLATEG